MKRSTLFAVLAAVVLVAAAVFLVSAQDDPAPVADAGSAVESTASAEAPETGEYAGSEELLVAGPLGDQILGEADAPVTIVEYASLTCPHCADFHKNTFPALKERYIDTGKVRFIFREFPLDQYATAGSMLARCAEDDKYFPIISAFFQQQGDLLAAQDPLTWLENFGKQVGFTQESLEACLSNQELMDNLMAVRDRAAEKFGVSTTPTFFINGKIKRGAMTIEELEKEIEPLTRS